VTRNIARRHSPSGRWRWSKLAIGIGIGAILVVSSSYLFILIAGQAKPPLVQVGNGIRWTLTGLDEHLYTNWSTSSTYMLVVIAFEDEPQGPEAVWRLNSTPLGGGEPVTHDFGERELAGLSLRVWITDNLGDGRADSNDSITVAAVDPTSFSPDTAYRISLWYATDMGGAGVSVGFRMHDGHLDSWISEEYHGHWM
jgi:hypothetical protein